MKKGVSKILILLISSMFLFSGCSFGNSQERAIKDFYFLSVDLSGTDIYYYNGETLSSECISQTEKPLFRAAYNEEGDTITALHGLEPSNIDGVVTYDIKKNEWKEILHREIIDSFSNGVLLDADISPNGNTIIILFRDNSNCEVIQYEVSANTHEVVLEGTVDNIQYISDNEIMYVTNDQFKIYDVVLKKDTLLMDNFKSPPDIRYYELSNDRKKIVAMGGKGFVDNQHLYLYDIKSGLKREILPEIFNTYYSRNFIWTPSDEYIYYCQTWAGFFNSGKPKLRAYDLRTKLRITLFEINEWTYKEFDFVRGQE